MVPASHMVRCAATVVVAASCVVHAEGETAADPTATCAYLPPEIAPHVVYYQSFEHGREAPAVNRIGARLRGAETPDTSGVAGRGYQCPDWEGVRNPLVLLSDRLAPSRPITVMLWWRLDEPMAETTCFNILALRGRGHIASFVRGKGQWCALPEPRRIFQVHGFHGIPDRNNPWSERIWIEPGTWHHTAITVAAASDVSVYWDGTLRNHYVIKGREFRDNDVNSAGLGRSYGPHPMSVDEVVVLSCVLHEDQIRRYLLAVRALADRRFPVHIPE